MSPLKLSLHRNPRSSQSNDLVCFAPLTLTRLYTLCLLLFSFINSWCLEIGVQYALLMRANKPETVVQSSALFLLAPRGLSNHVCSSLCMYVHRLPCEVLVEEVVCLMRERDNLSQQLAHSTLSLQQLTISGQPSHVVYTSTHLTSCLEDKLGHAYSISVAIFSSIITNLWSCSCL